MRILITGGQGRIGSFLARELERDHDLTLLDVQEGTATPHRFIRGDVQDEETCKRAVEGMEAIVHLAANVNPYPPHTYQRNTVGTWNLGEAACRAGVPRLLFSSSINVYGQGRYKIGSGVYTPPYLPIDENVPPRPDDSYGLSKLANEQALRGFSDAYGLRAYCFRLPAVWFPSRTESYVPRPLEYFPPLTAARVIDPWNYIDVRDIVSAFRLALGKPDLPAYAVSYLVADDTTRPERTRDLLERFLPDWLSLGGEAIPGHAPWFSAMRAKQDLGWRPQYTWRK